MLASRVYKAIAIGYAILYGVVGLTGEALYYFSADAPARSAGARLAQVEGYYHVHGPDLHLHFHAHPHHSPRTGSPIRACVGDSDGETKGKTLSRWEDFHRPHGSPLLGLIGKLKLSQPVGAVSGVAADVLVSLSYEPATVIIIEISTPILPRAPPVRLS